MLYAGGEFATAGGINATRVARWDGTSWSALGSGIEGPDYATVWALALDGQRNLYAGGLFTKAGNKGSSNFAVWHGDAIVEVPGPPASPAGLALHAAAPNPFVRSTVLSFELPRASHVRLDVLDVSGRRVRTLLSESRPPGRHSVTWDGTDERGRRSAAGVYQYRMQAGTFVATRQLVLLP
jgi:hypothetical protein